MSLPREDPALVIHRAQGSRSVETMLFGGLGLVVTVIAAVTLASGVALAFVEFALGSLLWVFSARARRSGYLCVSPSLIVLRTTARTRVILVRDIAEVTAVERWHLMTRVIPTLWFRDGSAIPLGDFSMRAALYHHDHGRGRFNQVDATIVLIRSVLS